MNTVIKSSKNDRIKYIKSLSQKKNRWKERKYVIEGIRAIMQMIENSSNIREVYYSDRVRELYQGEEVLRLAEDAGIDTVEISEEVFDSLTETESPQYILAVASLDLHELEEVIEKGRKLILLDRIQDPGNLGTIIRTAEAMGFNGVVIIKGTADIYNSKVLRSTMGVDLPAVHFDSAERAISELKKSGIKIISTSLDAEKMPHDVDLSDNIAIVIGNEARGISEEVELNSDELIKIPMVGSAESLNAAVASSMIMYESLRQKIKF